MTPWALFGIIFAAVACIVFLVLLESIVAVISDWTWDWERREEREE